MKKPDGISKKVFLFLWLVYPFIGLIYLLRNFRKVNAIWPFLLISFYFGLSFVVDLNSGADSTRYASELDSVFEDQRSFSEYIVGGFLADNGDLDIYQPLLTWLVSRFTGNYQWLFGIFASVFGFFWFKSLMLIRHELPTRLMRLTILVLFLIAFINPIWNINGVRMWTAMQVFFYGVLILYLKNDSKGWVFLAITPLIHFSFVLPLLIYISYRIIPLRNIHILFVIYLGTFFVNELNFDFLRQQFEQLPSFLDSRKGYLSEQRLDSIASAKENLSIHVWLSAVLLKYSITAMVVWVYLKNFRFNIYIGSRLTTLFLLTLYFGSFANLMVNIPSGGRFLVLANLLACLSFLLYRQTLSLKISQSFSALLQGAIILVLIFRTRLAFDFVGIFFFFGNPLLNLFAPDKVTIMNYIKDLF